MAISTSDAADPLGAIEAEAARLGLVMGVAPALESWPEGDRLLQFLALGRHGTMGWMADKAGWRKAPRALWPEAQSVIALGLSYRPEGDPLAVLKTPDKAAISVYAARRDYHDVLKKRIKALARFIAATFSVDVKAFVDTAPAMEKPLAARARLGWQGKHTNLVSREAGSWLFLGAIYTTLRLPSARPHEDRCGSCRACLDVCPTQAFPAPYQLDARRCLSYLTIEHKGPIPREFRAAMGNRVFGCDDCLAVCPWNSQAKIAADMALAAKAELAAADLESLVRLDDADFRALFAQTPVKRLGHARFLRNVLIAIGNSASARLAPSARERLAHADPIVRGAAVWALSRLEPEGAFRRLADAYSGSETDPGVLEEFSSALSEAS